LGDCCLPLLLGERQATTAEELMRSRYVAFVRRDGDYLLRTWHPRTRPSSLMLHNTPAWTLLEVRDVVDGGVDDSTGEVEFVAHHVGGDLHERSLFERRAGRWFYLDGHRPNATSPPGP